MGVNALKGPPTPPRSRRVFWVIGPVMILLAFGVRTMLRARSGAGAAGTPAPGWTFPNTAAGAGSEPGASQARPAKVKVYWQVEVKRDPFRSDRVFPPAEAKPQLVTPEQPRPDAAAVLREARERLQFTAVIVGETPVAVINGRAYKKGSVVSGFRIVEIAGRQITVQKGDVRAQLAVIE